MPTSATSAIDRDCNPTLTAAARPAATSRVAPICPTAKATRSRRLCQSSSPSASTATTPGNQIWIESTGLTKALLINVPIRPSPRLCRLVLALRMTCDCTRGPK